jgi:hypothetical protein
MNSTSVQSSGCPFAQDNQKSRRTTKNNDANCRSCPADNHKFVKTHIECLKTDNETLCRTTKNFGLVFCGTTIQFPLFRTLK